jgi:hypothetical protein
MELAAASVVVVAANALIALKDMTQTLRTYISIQNVPEIIEAIMVENASGKILGEWLSMKGLALELQWVP